MYKNDRSELHKGHRKRVKDKFIANGLEDFTDIQTLEAALFFCIPQGDTNEIAHRLINKFGSLSAVFDATDEQLLSVPGVGYNTYTFLKFMPELMRRYRMDKISDDNIFESREKIARYLSAYFMTATSECAVVMCFDKKRRLLGTSSIPPESVGAMSNARRIAELAITMKADSIVLAHNHPSGICAPSNVDISATNSLCASLSAVGINLLEHYIIAGEEYLGLKDYIITYGYKND